MMPLKCFQPWNSIDHTHMIINTMVLNIAIYGYMFFPSLAIYIYFEV
jgi:hypothetical protein